MARRSRVHPVSNEPTSYPRAVSEHLEDCWDEPEHGSHRVHPDLTALQGAWSFVSGKRRAQFLISGNRFTVHFADGDIYMGTFSLVPFVSHRAMDVCIDEGPRQHKGQTALCIYEVDGDTLRWCTAGPGQAERPTDFPTEESRWLSLVFRRERAHGLM